MLKSIAFIFILLLASCAEEESEFTSQRGTNSKTEDFFPAAVDENPFNFLFVASSTAKNISGFTINKDTGILTSISSMPFEAGDEPKSLVASPARNFLYVADGTGSKLLTFTIDMTSGYLSLLTSLSLTNMPSEVAISSDGRCLFVADVSPAISSFLINDNGIPEPLGEGLTLTGAAIRLFADPLGRFVFALHSGGVDAFSIDSVGKLTLVLGSPFVAGTSPSGLTVDPIGRFLFVSNSGSNDISVFSIGPSTGTLAPIDSHPSLANPSAILASADGNWVLASSSDNSIHVFRIGKTGDLAPSLGSPFATDGDSPLSLAMTLNLKHLYVLNTSSSNISALSFDSQTGHLLRNVESPVMFSVGNPSAFAIK